MSAPSGSGETRGIYPFAVHTPVTRDGLVRDELLVKLAAAAAAGQATSALGVIRAQRTATLGLLQQHTRRKAVIAAA